MDPLRSYSFPGFAFLLAQLIYRFVPYGNTLLIFVLLLILLSGTAQFIYHVCCRRATVHPGVLRHEARGAAYERGSIPGIPGE